jgi:hypothetical protein
MYPDRYERICVELQVIEKFRRPTRSAHPLLDDRLEGLPSARVSARQKAAKPLRPI